MCLLTRQVPAVHAASSVPNSYNARVSSTQLPLSPISDDFGNERSSVRHLSVNIFLWQGAFRQVSPEPYYSGFSATQESLFTFSSKISVLEGRFLGFSISALGVVAAPSVCFIYLLYVYFPLVNLLLLHSPVVVNNSLSIQVIVWFIFPDWTLTDADINIRFLLLNSWQIVRMFMIAHTLTIFPLGFMIFKLAIFYLLFFILNQRLIIICFFV